jgi:hypothetical protein
LAASPSNLIGCDGQNVLNLKKMFDAFVQLGLKIISGKFHEDCTDFMACGYVPLIFDNVSMRNNLLHSGHLADAFIQSDLQ